jgi:hypothetical protein
MQPYAALGVGTSLTAAFLLLPIVTIVAYCGVPTWPNRPLPRAI